MSDVVPIHQQQGHAVAPAQVTVQQPAQAMHAQQPAQQDDAQGDQPQANYKFYSNVMGLLVVENREQALYELSKKRDQFPDLAPTLWYSVGVMASLLQEVISVYKMLCPADLAGPASNRVCNALALLQCIASHNDTRMLCIKAHLPLFLYPFLNTATKSRPFEYLRLTSLGVIGALVKADDAEVVRFLLSTEIIPLCLRIMETGSELSKTVATFIVQKILLFDIGLQYLCATPERFYTVSSVLAKMTTGAEKGEKPPARLLKHVIRCYLRLSDHARARDALKTNLPNELRDSTFSDYLGDDLGMRRWLFQLLLNIGDPAVTALQQEQQQRQQQASQQATQQPSQSVLPLVQPAGAAVQYPPQGQ
eukprot:TRINITY_DN31261_c0_g1_i1.p1 TRINITY_DN31261_c0_g1~~TRINITY_DN31261_c0_g1_i1.p1  ORF type:complete len:364 (+),score=157.96 TRINITY_DN31261_c0_g1_i1:117-1208(+)